MNLDNDDESKDANQGQDDAANAGQNTDDPEEVTGENSNQDNTSLNGQRKIGQRVDDVSIDSGDNSDNEKFLRGRFKNGRMEIYMNKKMVLSRGYQIIALIMC